MSSDQEIDLIQFCKEIEPLLKKEPLLTAIHKGQDDNLFELFFEDEPNPFTLVIQMRQKMIEDMPKFECFFQYKPIPGSQHHFSMAVLPGFNPEHMTKEIIDNYQTSMKKNIIDVKKGFKKDTGQDSDDVLTSDQ